MVKNVNSSLEGHSKGIAQEALALFAGETHIGQEHQEQLKSILEKEFFKMYLARVDLVCGTLSGNWDSSQILTEEGLSRMLDQAYKITMKDDLYHSLDFFVTSVSLEDNDRMSTIEDKTILLQQQWTRPRRLNLEQLATHSLCAGVNFMYQVYNSDPNVVSLTNTQIIVQRKDLIRFAYIAIVTSVDLQRTLMANLVFTLLDRHLRDVGNGLETSLRRLYYRYFHLVYLSYLNDNPGQSRLKLPYIQIEIEPARVPVFSRQPSKMDSNQMNLIATNEIWIENAYKDLLHYAQNSQNSKRVKVYGEGSINSQVRSFIVYCQMLQIPFTLQNGRLAGDTSITFPLFDGKSVCVCVCASKFI